MIGSAEPRDRARAREEATLGEGTERRTARRVLIDLSPLRRSRDLRCLVSIRGSSRKRSLPIAAAYSYRIIADFLPAEHWSKNSRCPIGFAVFRDRTRAEFI